DELFCFFKGFSSAAPWLTAWSDVFHKTISRGQAVFSFVLSARSCSGMYGKDIAKQAACRKYPAGNLRRFPACAASRNNAFLCSLRGALSKFAAFFSEARRQL